MDILLLSNLEIVIGTLLLICIGALFTVLNKKTNRIIFLQKIVSKLKKSFDSLDEQAKLIVKTDIELNKTQEELDKRLESLDSLQKASRLISTTLNEKEIFLHLDQSIITELGFEKNLTLIYDKKETLHCRVSLGFSKNDADFIVSNFSNEAEIIKILKSGETFCSVQISTQQRAAISQLFGLEQFILSPILTQNGMIGFVFIGNQSNTSPITEGDQELIAILANQIGQSLENARLFEEVYRSSQVLETKVQERTKQLSSALEEVQKINKAKSDFISAVSHELRTPLTSIKGYASILMAGKLGEIPEPVKERLNKVNKHSDNLVALINDLLDISRIESGRVEMNITQCQIKDLIENVHDLLTPQMKEKNIQWTTNINENLPEISVDGRQIERVFINLVSNAIKFTPQNGTISIKAHITNDIVELEVSDTGIGISDEDIARLFDEFYRVENKINQNVKGTGLGLALTKKIIEAHNGKIWITSKLNEGTTFHFTLQPSTQKDFNL
ncbi:hypothetical protein MNBD_UNCLBAC01-1676 [hydrothermal vent metagenome]|uniref:histidine kinase n=1 Tax=hydrothermal vent metagenome TaxID=652676 RepID=A0A3B1DAT1_9ZZZZ